MQLLPAVAFVAVWRVASVLLTTPCKRDNRMSVCGHQPRRGLDWHEMMRQ